MDGLDLLVVGFSCIDFPYYKKKKLPETFHGLGNVYVEENALK